MKKIISILLFLVIVSATVSASFLIPVADIAKEKSKAVENSKVINGDWEIERIDFVHYAKPDGKGKPPKDDGGSNNACYDLMGQKWKSLPVNYVINPENPEGLSESFVVSELTAATNEWDSASNVFGAYSIDRNSVFGYNDGENNIVFDYDKRANVIAVASVWRTRKGKQIVEFDIKFNTQYEWGDASVDPTKMDLQNIAVHELGHGIGLLDVYDSSCSDVTMYGYATEGETKKRSLAAADMLGIQSMY